MSVKDDSLTYFSNLPKTFSSTAEKNLEKPRPKFEFRQKFINYEVNNDNLHRAIRDITFPFECLRHFDDKQKANRRSLSPLKFFEYKTDAELKKSTLAASQDSDSGEVLKFKGILATIRMTIGRKREKRQSLANIPDIMAENLERMTCETYFSLCTNISNILWLFYDAARKYHELKTHRLEGDDKESFIFDFSKLTTVFEKIFYEAYFKLGKPTFKSLSGPKFVDFLKWRSICHSGPYLDTTTSRQKVAVFVMGQFEILKVFNFGQPLHGLYLFDKETFKNLTKLEPLPIWYYNTPKIIYEERSEIMKVIKDVENTNFIENYI